MMANTMRFCKQFVAACLGLASLGGVGCPTEPDARTWPGRSCDTEFRFTPVGAVGDIVVAGSWNGFASDTSPLADDDGDGTWTASLSLPPGLHAYKLVVDGEWILDPATTLRAWRDGLENSAVLVPDCELPRFTTMGPVEASDGEAQVVLRWESGRDGAAPDPASFVLTHLHGGTSRMLDPSAWNWDADEGRLSIQLSGLPDGKHRVTVRGSDVEGRPSDDLLLAWWIEASRWEWRDAMIGMVMTDRFRDGDPGNNPGPTPNAVPSADFLGGDLQGVTQGLLDGTFGRLGVTALWLSPWVTNPGSGYGDSDGNHIVTGYHGYWPIRAREVDPRLGGEAALDALVEAAHAAGIRVLMDLVVNHVHEAHPDVAEHPEWFHRVEDGGCVCGTAGCDWTERRLDCLFTPYLPDVDWTRDDVMLRFVEDASWWMERFDLDGLRVDAVKHVPDSAVNNLSTLLRRRFEAGGTPLFLMGETAMGWNDCHADDPACNAENYGTIARYIGPGALDGQFDFVLFHSTALRTFAREEAGMIHARVWTENSQRRYPLGSVMTPYIGSHDTARFLSVAAQPELAGNKWPEQGLPTRPDDDLPYEKLALALGWNLTLPGAPLLYLGDEYGEWGGNDPDNRHMWRGPADRTERETALATRVEAVGQARGRSAALRRGALVTLRNTEDLWAYGRVVEETGESAIVVLNRAATPATETLFFTTTMDLPEGTVLVDAVSGSEATVQAAGALTLTVPGRSVSVWLPSAAP